MVLEALPDAIRLGRQILRPKRRSNRKSQHATDGEGSSTDDILARRKMEEEPASLWGRVSKAKSEIIMLLIDAATVRLAASASERYRALQLPRDHAG